MFFAINIAVCNFRSGRIYSAAASNPSSSLSSLQDVRSHTNTERKMSVVLYVVLAHRYTPRVGNYSIGHHCLVGDGIFT